MKPEDGLPSDCMPSLPDMLRPVKVGMLSAAGLCAALAACLTGMVPIEARMALMLNDILALPSPVPWPSVCCVCGLSPQDDESSKRLGGTMACLGSIQRTFPTDGRWAP